MQGSAGRVRAACAGVFVAALAAAAAMAVWAEPGGTARARWEAPKPSIVTLVTGDRVRVSGATGGRQTVTVVPAAGRRTRFQVTEREGETYVVPQDVAALIPRVLDPALFNVSALIEDGYAGRPLPLIVSGSRSAPPGTDLTRRLESVDAVAVDVDAGARLGRALRARSSGVEQVRLDRRVRADLGTSVPQIGAPAVWADGHDGTGVTVAVLDTGVDAAHPALAGAVAAEADFTDGVDARDGHGHGTHVASIVGGRAPGVRGVAPGATLVSGKVLDDSGNGWESAIIDGMEWAADERDADVVNMSLGAAGGTEDDLMAQAIERLTAEHGALFVVAAGNAGCDACVGSPGAARGALTVGAVDREDALADFSSRGPVPGSIAVKPDVTAPGVEILAARASGTGAGLPGDELRASMSGTSMATPHVAGAAALLLDARPGTAPAAVKGALVSTAKPGDESVFAQGAGRIDVARADGAPVVIEDGSLSFGHFAYPHDGREPVTRTVTFRNRGAADATLALATDVDALTLPASVTVPAGGSAAVDVTLDTATAPAARHAGVLLARAPDGSELRTPVAFEIEGERYDLHVRGIARDGRPAFGGFHVLDVEDGSVAAQRYFHGEEGPCTGDQFDGPPCVRVPPGTYSVMGFVFTAPPDAPSEEFNRTVASSAIVGDPEVTVTGDTELVLDARRAREVTVHTPDHDTRANLGAAHEIALHRAPESGPAIDESFVHDAGTLLEERFYMQPTEPVRRGELAASTRWQLEQPSIAFDAHDGPRLDPDYFDPVWHSDNSWQFPRFDGRARLPVVDAGTGTRAEIAGRDVRGAIALVRRTDALSVPDQGANAAAAGARLLAVYNDAPGPFMDPGEINVALDLPSVRLTGEEGEAVLRRLRHGPLRVRVEGVPASPYRYDLVLAEQGRIPTDLRHVVRERDLARYDVRLHDAPGGGRTYSKAAFPFQPWQSSSASVVQPVIGGARVRQEYLTAAPGLSWDHAAFVPEEPYNAIWSQPPEADSALATPVPAFPRPGARESLGFYEAPIAPGLDPERPVVRQGDVLAVALAGWVDANGNFGPAQKTWQDESITSDFRIYEDGELLAETDLLPVGTLPLVEGPARYRIEYAVGNRSPWAELSDRTRTSWEFSSRRPEGDSVATLPLIAARFSGEVDLRNRLLGREIDVLLAHQAGAPAPRIVTPSVSVSYDDGDHWRPAPVRASGHGRWSARLDPPPRGARYLSLRLRAADEAGNRVEQEVRRAVGL